MCPKYITGSLRESCKIPIKGFNKEPDRASCSSSCALWCRCLCDILHRMLVIHAVSLAEIFLGCCGLLLNGRERQFETYVMSTVITLNTYLQGLPSHHQSRGYHITNLEDIYMFKIMRQTIVEQSKLEIFTK